MSVSPYRLKICTVGSASIQSRCHKHVFFVAISVDIGRLGIESDKTQLEDALKQNGYQFGIVNSNRYFFKPEAKPHYFTAGESFPKDECRKINTDVIERIHKGLFNDTLCVQQCFVINLIISLTFYCSYWQKGHQANRTKKVVGRDDEEQKQKDVRKDEKKQKQEDSPTNYDEKQEQEDSPTNDEEKQEQEDSPTND